jgi:hypothetical protein
LSEISNIFQKLKLILSNFNGGSTVTTKPI